MMRGAASPRSCCAAAGQHEPPRRARPARAGGHRRGTRRPRRPHAAPAAEHGGPRRDGPAEILMHHVLDVRYGDFSSAVPRPSKHLVFFVLAALS